MLLIYYIIWIMATPSDDKQHHANDNSGFNTAALESNFQNARSATCHDIATLQSLIPTSDSATLQELLPLLERNMKGLSAEHERSNIFMQILCTLNDRSQKMEEDFKKMVEVLRNKEISIQDLQGRLAVQDSLLTSLQMNIIQLENTSYEGVLMVEIKDYQRKKVEAMKSGSASFFSMDFYSARNGYRMCGRIYLNGDGAGRGTHLSLFFAIKKGKYDNYLTWPFQHQVTFTLLNQTGADHLSDRFRPDYASSSFRKPVKEFNIASGCPLFVSHDVIENRSRGFLMNDTICIRVTVDPK